MSNLSNNFFRKICYTVKYSGFRKSNKHNRNKNLFFREILDLPKFWEPKNGNVFSLEQGPERNSNPCGARPKDERDNRFLPRAFFFIIFPRTFPRNFGPQQGGRPSSNWSQKVKVNHQSPITNHQSTITSAIWSWLKIFPPPKKIFFFPDLF